jgi:hypothetical protein
MLGKFKKTLDKGVATVSVKSNEFIEITKLKTQNTTLEKEIDFLKTQLGAAYYSQWKSDQVESSSLEELCNDIKTKEDTIESNLEKIDDLQKENVQILGAHAQTGTVTCTCGKENSSAAKFCISCGNKLEVQPETVQSESLDMKACTCGNMVKKTAKFCSKCGNKFDVESISITEEEISEETLS